MFNIGPAELLIIGLVLLIAVGPEQLPGVIRRVGSTVAQLRSMTDGLRSEFMAGLDEIERATDLERWSDDDTSPSSSNGSKADPVPPVAGSAETSTGSSDAADDADDPAVLDRTLDTDTDTDTDTGSGDERSGDDGRGHDGPERDGAQEPAVADTPGIADLDPDRDDESSPSAGAPLDEAPTKERTLKPSWGKQEGEPA